MGIKTKMTWQKELPNSEGNWLFVIMWECGCCAIDTGFVDIIKNDEEEGTYLEYLEQGRILLPNGFWLSWEPEPHTWRYLKKKNKKVTLEDMEITAWSPIEYPPKEYSQYPLPLISQ